MLQIHHPNRLLYNTNKPSKSFTNQRDGPAFAFFPHVLFPKKQEARYVTPGSNYFLGYGLWLFINNCCRPPAAQKVTQQTASPRLHCDSRLRCHRLLGKKTWNIKDLESRITSLMKRPAVSSPRFSSVNFKGRGWSFSCATQKTACAL